jgi:hypothetical protein
MLHHSIFYIAAALLLCAGCKKGTTSTAAFYGIYIEKDAIGNTLRLDFIGNGKVIVTGGKLNSQYWTSTSDSFNLELNSTRIFFIDPVNISNKAGYWYHLSTMAGVNTLFLSPCAPGLPCIEDYGFVQQP